MDVKHSAEAYTYVFLSTYTCLQNYFTWLMTSMERAAKYELQRMVKHELQMPSYFSSCVVPAIKMDDCCSGVHLIFTIKTNNITDETISHRRYSCGRPNQINWFGRFGSKQPFQPPSAS